LENNGICDAIRTKSLKKVVAPTISIVYPTMRNIDTITKKEIEINIVV
jgi:hypothetical protein